MEILNISIPDIKVPHLNIPTANPYQVLNVPPPSIKLPGCVKYHRDASPKNTALYNDDTTGTSISCAYGSMPTFEPMLYDRRKIEIVENKEQEKRVENTETPIQEEVKPDIPKEKKEIKVVPCPGSKDQRIGDFRNSSRLERVIGHEKSEDGTRCITIYEDVPFKDQYIPEVSTIVSTAVIGLVAASSPLLLNVIKPLVKNIVKKLTKKKDKIE
jgi:uncharacterized Zn finger protein (UPF0148 family)